MVSRRKKHIFNKLLIITKIILWLQEARSRELKRNFGGIVMKSTYTHLRNVKEGGR